MLLHYTSATSTAFDLGRAIKVLQFAKHVSLTSISHHFMNHLQPLRPFSKGLSRMEKQVRGERRVTDPSDPQTRRASAASPPSAELPSLRRLQTTSAAMLTHAVCTPPLAPPVVQAQLMQLFNATARRPHEKARPSVERSTICAAAVLLSLVEGLGRFWASVAPVSEKKT